MTSGAIRVPPPSRPTKKQGLTTHLTPRHSRKPEPVETVDFQHETETDSNNSNNSNRNRTGTSMDLFATFAANSSSANDGDGDPPLSPPRSMLDLLRNADTSDPSVLSPRESSSASDPSSSPVSSYQVPASFRLHHRHTSGLKRSRSVAEKENAHNITTTVAQLFSGGPKANKKDRTSVDSSSSDVVPYDWTVNVDQLSPEKKTKLYWNLCYGGGATKGSSTDMNTHTHMNTTFGTNISNKYSLQESWSARRLPPPKGWYVSFHFWIASRLC